MRTEARLYERVAGGAVRCRTCQRRCLIPDGKTGWCKTRRNERGRLWSLVYGAVSSLSVNPIEKKPVYHFYPGSRWLSLGSVGCNFRCPGCQNWRLSHWTHGPMRTRYLSPAASVAAALRAGCRGISWTFNEPTVWFEYTLDAARLAKRKGLATNYVTNGAITPEAFVELAPVLDVFRVDIKGFTAATHRRIGHLADPTGIRTIAQTAKRRGLHVEVVTNLIPGLNDRDGELQSIAAWIRESLGADTPWHVTRFVPHLELSQVAPTPVETLERARVIGTDAGLWYVYVGNVPGHRWAHTYCHVCGKLVIERRMFSIARSELRDGACGCCGARIAGTFAPADRASE